MPKHAFKFPPEVIDAIKKHVQSAINAISPERYKQEANYTAALLARLDGIAYDGTHGTVVFAATVLDDRGPKSAESRYGADHAITATISDGQIAITKVILVQAKLGRICDLQKKEKEFLNSQIKKMKEIVLSPKVMEIPTSEGNRYPAMISGRRILENKEYRPMPLPEYFVSRITTTLDGCTDPEVVAAVTDSSLSKLDVRAKIRV